MRWSRSRSCTARPPSGCCAGPRASPTRGAGPGGRGCTAPRWPRRRRGCGRPPGHIGPQRLQPFVSELLDRLLRAGELTLTPDVDKLVRRLSSATLGRWLAPARATRPPRGLSTTRAGTWLRHEIPIRTFTEWSDTGPGFLEIDLVAHCGSSTRGFYLCTLCAVDIATAWVELEAVWG